MQRRMRIGWIELVSGVYGGHVYNSMVQEGIAKFADLELIKLHNKFLPDCISGIERFLKLRGIKGEKDLWILEIPSLMMIDLKRLRGKKLALIHHDDFSGYPFYKRCILDLLWKKGKANLLECDGAVVVSEFWRKRISEYGLKKVDLIYNAFDIEQYEISDGEVAKFAKENGLEGKPVVYIGNCQRAKGVVETYEALKSLDCYLVTSGRKSVDLPVKNFECEFRSYLRLLKLSSVAVLMSKFDEGWCRTAHEAMLLGTPVIGSGRGGMRELLEGGGQIVCEDSKKLKELVENILRDGCNDLVVKRGQEFASKFTLERFCTAWQELIMSYL